MPWNIFCFCHKNSDPWSEILARLCLLYVMTIRKLSWNWFHVLPQFFFRVMHYSVPIKNHTFVPIFYKCFCHCHLFFHRSVMTITSWPSQKKHIHVQGPVDRCLVMTITSWPSHVMPITSNKKTSYFLIKLKLYKNIIIQHLKNGQFLQLQS